MIKIVKGTYGHREGNRIVAKNATSEPFEAAPEQEERLVKLGVAVYIKEQQENSKVSIDSGAGSGNNGADKLLEYNDKMKLDELKEIAHAYGVDASDARSKAAVIEMIEKAKSAAEESEDESGESNHDAPPTFGAADQVVE